MVLVQLFQVLTAGQWTSSLKLQDPKKKKLFLFSINLSCCFYPLTCFSTILHIFFQKCYSRRVKEVSTGQEPLPLTSNFSLHPLVLLLNGPCLEPEQVHVSFIRFPRVTTFPCLFKSISWHQGATLKAFPWIAEGLQGSSFNQLSEW